MKITKHNFRQVDALPYAKDGTLQKVIDELYGDGDLSEEADNLIEVTASDDILSMVEKAGIEYIDLRYKRVHSGLLAVLNYRDLRILAISTAMSLRMLQMVRRIQKAGQAGGLREVENDG